jgi:hypothetical protein
LKSFTAIPKTSRREAAAKRLTIPVILTAQTGPSLRATLPKIAGRRIAFLAPRWSMTYRHTARGQKVPKTPKADRSRTQMITIAHRRVVATVL